MQILRSNKGEGYVDVIIVVLIVMMLLSLGMKVYPAFLVKSDLNTFANEVVRVAEVNGNVGSETTAKANELRSALGLSPTMKWSKTGRIGLNEEVNLVVTQTVNIGFWEFGAFPITLTSKAVGRSEVYQK